MNWTSENHTYSLSSGGDITVTGYNTLWGTLEEQPDGTVCVEMEIDTGWIDRSSGLPHTFQLLHVGHDVWDALIGLTNRCELIAQQDQDFERMQEEHEEMLHQQWLAKQGNVAEA